MVIYHNHHSNDVYSIPQNLADCDARVIMERFLGMESLLSFLCMSVSLAGSIIGIFNPWDKQ